LQWDATQEVRAMVLGLERHATHPVALAFAEAWPDVEPAAVSDVRIEHGSGVSGRVEGRHVRVGSPAWIAQQTGPLPVALPSSASGLHTPVWVAIDGEVVAQAGFGDRIRPEAAETLARLRAEGWSLELLSGDAPSVVEATGRVLGFAPGRMRGGVSPEEKRVAIESLAQRGRVVMVGDGVNDAAAIAAATVGVGVSGGAEACLAAADVYLSRPGIASLAVLTQGARRTLRVIRLGLGVSLLWNLAGAALAMAGLVNPLVAAVAMPLSSACVVLLAWRSRTFTPEGT
jgi:Cu2+-exporting ATPase